MKPFITLLIMLFAVGCVSNSEEKKEKSSTVEIGAYDAVKVAPKSHHLLLENDQVRVLKVIIEPGEKEPFHTHQWPSVMYVEQSARMDYYGSDRTIVHKAAATRHEIIEPEPNWMGAEELHALHNIDTVAFRALRVELKQ